MRKPQVVEEMITLAKWMVVTLKDVSKAVGNSLNIRIGIDCGMAVTGIIGRLQRRFHAHGAVVSHAQKLEGACTKGAVHISKAVAARYPNLKAELAAANSAAAPHSPSTKKRSKDSVDEKRSMDSVDEGKPYESDGPRRLGSLRDLRHSTRQFDRGTALGTSFANGDTVDGLQADSKFKAVSSDRARLSFSVTLDRRPRGWSRSASSSRSCIVYRIVSSIEQPLLHRAAILMVLVVLV